MSSNIQAVAASFISDILASYLAASTDTLKVALYYQGAGLGYATTAYSATGEVSGTGYTAGGQTLTNGTSPAVSGPTAYWTPSASVVWTGLTIASPFDCWLLYDASKSNKAIAAFTFPAQTVTTGTFQIAFPPNAAATALIQGS